MKAQNTFAESLKVNKGLKALDLDHCGIPSEGIVVIGEALLVNSTLESLSLSKNSVGHGFVQFAKHLGENKGLKRLNLRACGINDVGAASLGKCIRKNSSLVEINIKNNLITGVGAHCLMEAVKDNNTLARLKVFRNKLTNKERVEFVKCMDEIFTTTTTTSKH